MKALFASVALGLFLAGAVAAPGLAQDYDFSAATRQMADNVSLYANGNVLVVVQQGGREIFRFQAGTTQEDTKYGLASASKWLSGAIILRMREKGLFSLDDPIGNHLPFFNDHSNENGVSGSVTIQQCISMKSGLYSTDTNPEINRFLTLEQSVQKIASDIPLAFAPGTKLAYEGCGLQTVGRICEVVDPQGRSWRTIAADELFTPVGMVNCDYDYFGDRNPAIAGGAQGTARAYLRYLQTLMNGGVTPDGQIYLRPRSVRHFLLNQTRDLPEHATPCPDPPEIYPDNTKPDYGTASWIMVDDPNFPQSREAVEVASPGAFGTWPWIDRKRNLRGIVYMYDNQFGGRKTFQNNLKVVQAIRDAIDAVGEPAKPVASIGASALSGRAPLTVNFDASGSTDPEGDALTCVWDFGSEAVVGKQISRIFATPGTYDVMLNVTDCKGTSAIATVTVTVNQGNSAPTIAAFSPESPATVNSGTAQAFSVDARDADGDPLSYSWRLDGAVVPVTTSVMTYSPAAADAGSHAIAVTVSDGFGGTVSRTWDVTVVRVNRPPVASAQSVSTPEDTARAITLTGSDPDGDALSYTIVTGPAHGTLSGTGPARTYVPAADYFGSDSFTFKVNDGEVDSAPATVSIDVSPVNDVPVADPQSVVTRRNTPVAVVLNGSDVEGSPLTYTVVTAPSRGKLSGTAPNLIYTPNAGVIGSDSFTFKVNDGQADSATVAVSISVKLFVGN